MGFFADEKWPLNHTRAGLLSTKFNPHDSLKMALQPNFRIILKALPDHDSKNIVFGTVLEGMDIVWAMEHMDDPRETDRTPKFECRIVDSGEIEVEAPYR